MDLFSHRSAQDVSSLQPLAEVCRPQQFDDFVGQKQIFEKNKNLIERLRAGRLQSLILWGPPGTGKTSFATALIKELSLTVYQENAIDLGTKRIREIGELGKRNLYEQNQKTLVFIDEIHRLNRGQQDVLLPFVERGYFYLIGATTENPSYHLNSALTSRCRLLMFELLTPLNLLELMNKVLLQKELTVEQVLEAEAANVLCEKAHGDARRLMNFLEELLEIKKFSPELFPVQAAHLDELFASSGLRFDKKGDEHYNVISAFIKSVRGSDPQAATYYLARLLSGGEDPVFIARRLVILASEDIGNADPQALTMAVNGLQAVELIGMPEARITLSQVTLYLSCAPKSNRSYLAINKAMDFVEKTGPLEVPLALRSAQTVLMRSIGYGKGYEYSHDGEKAYIPQNFLPAEVGQEVFYQPTERGFEKRMREYQAWVRGKKDPFGKPEES